MTTSSPFISVYENSDVLQVVKPQFGNTFLGSTVKEQTHYSTTLIREGYAYIPVSLILKAVKATGWEKGQSTKVLAMKLLEWSDKRFNWFETGFDWALALRIPDMLKFARMDGKLKNFRYRIKIH